MHAIASLAARVLLSAIFVTSGINKVSGYAGTQAYMESHGLPGCIQVTRPIVEKLGDEYVFLDRGEIEIKGKGLVNVWLMHGLRVHERAAAV